MSSSTRGTTPDRTTPMLRSQRICARRTCHGQHRMGLVCVRREPDTCSLHMRRRRWRHGHERRPRSVRNGIGTRRRASLHVPLRKRTNSRGSAHHMCDLERESDSAYGHIMLPRCVEQPSVIRRLKRQRHDRVRSQRAKCTTRRGAIMMRSRN